MNHYTSEKIAVKVSVAPPPEWVTVRSVDTQFTPSELGHSTVLLSDSQFHAEKRQQYFRVVQRLETMQAVQDASQYKLDFDPGTQEIVIHSVSVIRRDQSREQASRDRFQFLQREASLETFVIHGWATLLLLLEDVCVGDMIDASYTITTMPKLLPERFCLFNGMPLGISIRAFHLEVHFARSRAMQWKSSSKDLIPEVREEAGEICWAWKRENLLEAIPEPKLPAWFLAGTWIQVTDCQSWADVVGACLKTWPLENPGPEILQLAETIKADARTEEERVEKAITFVQDGFRYLSVNVTFGGQIPSPASDVLLRRFGDCKDLACLLVLLLRALGVPARPVLVHTMLAKKVRDFLPMPGAFNHVIVEYETGSERRWVDATRRLQGGGIHHRPIADFNVGLAIESGSGELRAMPDQPRLDGVYKLKESFQLNTAGPWSVLEVLVTAGGAEAEVLRNLFANRPESSIAAEREFFYAQMFPQVRRLGRMQHKDDRARDEFMLGEMFEISGAVRPFAGSSRSCYFPFASHLVQRVFRLPLGETRKHPCALIHPYNIEHVIDIELPGLPTRATPLYFKSHPVFRLGRKTRFAQGFVSVNFSFQTLSDSVVPDQFADFRKTLDEIWRETTMFMELPLGVPSRRLKYREAKL